MLLARRSGAQEADIMNQLQVGDRVKILDGGKDDEGTVLDMDERTEMVVVYLGRHLGGRPFHRDASFHRRPPRLSCSPETQHACRSRTRSACRTAPDRPASPRNN